MSQSDKARAKKAASAQAGSPSDVRALAKERARRRARISKRKANRQRGLLGASVAAIVGVILWVLVGVASLPVLVAGVGTGIGLVYLAGFGYVVNEMSQATAVDEEAIATIDRKLKASKGAAHLARSRRPVAPRVGNRPVNARPEAARARTARPETAAARADADQRAEESVKKLLGPQAEGEPKVSARWPKTAQSAVGGGQGGLSARSAERAGGAGSGSGLAMSLEPEIIESSDGIDVISAENSEERSSVLPVPVRTPAWPTVWPTAWPPVLPTVWPVPRRLLLRFPRHRPRGTVRRRRTDPRHWCPASRQGRGRSSGAW